MMRRSIYILGLIFILPVALAGCRNDVPLNKAAETSALTAYPYQGKVTTQFMPNDWTFAETDVPILISELQKSKFSALYVDVKKSLRVISEKDIQISYDEGKTWSELATDEVSGIEFSEWLWQNDPIPGYSMEQLQERIKENAEVRHVVFDDKQEMYFVIDKQGVQIELVQPDKIESILIDGTHLMFTSTGTGTNYRLSSSMVNEFKNILEDAELMDNREAVTEWKGVIKKLVKNGANFYELHSDGTKC